jgi:hypothetical protein
MSSELHIDNLSDDTIRHLERDAAVHGVSPAEWAARVLSEHYCGVDPLDEPQVDKATAVSRLFGTWNEEQVREFMEATADFERIDEDMWK